MNRVLWVVALVFVWLGLAFGYRSAYGPADDGLVPAARAAETAPLPPASPSSVKPVVPARPAPVLQRVTVAAVGDVLLHAPLQRQASSRPEAFQSLWSQVTPFLQQADVAYANLEGPVAAGLTHRGKTVPDPGTVFDNAVYTSYPLFNYPNQLLTDLKASGIDVVSTANNHALDRGAEGVRRTLAALAAAGLPYTGTRLGRDDETPWFALTEAKGFHIAWLACSFSTNGIPDGQKQVLDCYKDKELVLAIVRALAEQPNVSAVMVTPHWGMEYMEQPLAQERALGRALLDAGATAVLGSHPHVPQPWEKHTTPDGREGLILYSLGNFVSGQFHRLHTRASLLAWLTLEGLPGQKLRLVSASYEPLEMKRTVAGLEVVPIRDGSGTPAIAAQLIKLLGPWEGGLEFSQALPAPANAGVDQRH
jgi:poly-gamma-glutamate synthesis protein (capsule biosynthesis protein)